MHKKYFSLALSLLICTTVLAQNELNKDTHKILGAQVDGYEVNIPLGKSFSKSVWEDYAKFLGRSEATASHQAYQAVFRANIYDKELLLFSQITGDENTSRLWAGIDPQGVPKDTLKLLQSELKEFVKQFNIRVRTVAAQKKIDESEQAASFLSKEFEKVKREERRDSRGLERTSEKIIRYEEELIQLRTDSTNYVKSLSELSIKLDSLGTELEKVKGMVELYKLNLEGIE